MKSSDEINNDDLRKQSSSVTKKRHILIVTLTISICVVLVAAWFLWKNVSSGYIIYFERIYDVQNGVALVQTNSRTISIVDIEARRELISFRDDDPLIERNLQVEPGVVLIRRIQQFDLIDIESGGKVILPGEFGRIHQVFDGMIVAEGSTVISVTRVAGGETIAEERDVYRFGIIEIGSGREVLPFRYLRIRPIFDEMSRDVVGVEAIRGGRSYIYRFSSDKELELVDSFSVGNNFWSRQTIWYYLINGSIAVREYDVWYLMDFETGYKRRVPGDIDEIREVFDGVALVTCRTRESFAIVELETDSDLISSEEHHAVVLLSRSKAIVQSGLQNWGVVDFRTGEILIPLGKYETVFSFWHSRDYSEEYLVVADGEDVGLLDLRSGEMLIPFGRYGLISLYDDGVVAVLV